MENHQKIALVTGGNRGLGLEVSRQLATLGITVILTARAVSKGNAVVEQLKQQGLTRVIFQPLDVTDAASIQQLGTIVRQQFGRLDILINNAGVFPDSHATISALNTDVEILRQAMETNVYGAFRLCQLFIPMMKEQHYGRIVNVSSGMGQLSEMNGGYPGYRISKTAMNAVTRIFADELQGVDILINSMCPGWVRTDMGGKEAPRSVEEGADTMVWLATLPTGGPSGGFFRDRKPIHW